MNSDRWPEWSNEFTNQGFPEHSLLAGTEARLWNALGKLEPSDFAGRKQLTLRKALAAEGVGWVATNTTPMRIAIGGLYDAAKACHEGKLSDQAALSPDEAPCPEIEIHSQKLPKTAIINGPLEKLSFDESLRSEVWQALQSYGACVIRKAIDKESLTQEQVDIAEGAPVKLSESAGNGRSGQPESIYGDLNNKPQWLTRLERKLWDLLLGPGAPEEVNKVEGYPSRKTIVLLGGRDAENWAHQDNNDECPSLQAMLMLSEPGQEFCEGQFYVAKQSERNDELVRLLRYTIDLENPGDLVVFQAGKNSGFWHGMMAIEQGREAKAEGQHLRLALGMLQPKN